MSTTWPRPARWPSSRSSTTTPHRWTASWWWCSAVTARSCAEPSSRDRTTCHCWGSTSATWASSPRPRRSEVEAVVDAIVDRQYAVEERMTLQVVARHGSKPITTTWAVNEASVEKASRERMLEVVARGRRPAAVAVGLRRRRGRDTHRVDRLRVLRRRPGGVAGGRGAAHGPDQRARALRAPARRLADSVPSRSRCCPTPRARRALVRRPAYRSTCRPGRASRCGAARDRCGWPGCTHAPFTDRLVAKFELPVAGWRGAASRRWNGDGP